tara:strand:- start:243 stop:1226 length:984 start_codon:yes stop_codon:yes gene_type:complete
MAEEINEIGPDEEVTLSEGDLDIIDSLENDSESEPGVSFEESTESAEVEADPVEDNSVEDSTVDDGQKYNPDLTSRAQQYGLDPSDFGTEKSLSYVVDQFDQGNANLSQWNNWYQGQQQQGGTEAQLPQQPQFSVDLSEDYDEGLKSAINAMAANMQSHYDGQLDVIAQSVLNQQQYVNYAQQQQSQEYAAGELEQFNTAITNLSNENLFGSGAYQDLDPGTQEAKNMESVYEQMTVLANGYQSSGKGVPPVNDLVKQAYNSIFADEIGNQDRNRRNDRLRSNSKRRLGGGVSPSSDARPIEDINDAVNSNVLKDFYDSAMVENGSK